MSFCSQNQNSTASNRRQVPGICTPLCISSLIVLLAGVIPGCSENESAPSTGGSIITGGRPATGGNGSGGANTGGTNTGGTTVATGGSKTGGASAGGSTPTSGGASTGGAAAGGASSGGSSSASGGAITGGTTHSSGGSGAGGTTTGGGTSVTGGSPSGGATTPTGGSNAGGSTGPLSEASTFPTNLAVPTWWTLPVNAPDLKAPAAPSFTLCGFGEGTTGGGSASPKEVSSLDALKTAVAGTAPAVVVVTAKISLGGMIDVGSNKTIIGKGSSGHLDNGGLKLSGSTNVIIRNLTISNWKDPSWDGISLEKASSKVWIDHNTFYTPTLKDGTDGEANSLEKNVHDGAIDLKQGSQNVTISWNSISNVWKMSLLGSSNSDRGTWNVTYHHNAYFRIGSRMPSIRGGKGHIFNNYFKEIFISGINSRLSAQVLAENNYFERANNPIVSADSVSEPGFVVKKGNIFVPAESETVIPTSTLLVPAAGTFTSASYTCTVDPADKVPALVANFAGVGKIP